MKSTLNNQMLNLPWKNWKDFLSRASENGESRQPNMAGHLLITCGTVIAISLVFSWFNWFADNQEKEWFVQQETKPLTLQTQTLKGTPVAKVRLSEQFEEIQLRIKSHSAVMVFFYKQYYISGSMSLTLGLFAALCGFLISRDGWQKANNGLINAFLVTSTFVFFYNQLPLIFKQDSNIAGNKTLYLDYISLRNEILSYAATNKTISQDAEKNGQFTEVEVDQFIHQLDKRMAELNQVAIDFDLKRVTDLPDFYRVAPQTSPNQ